MLLRVTYRYAFDMRDVIQLLTMAVSLVDTSLSGSAGFSTFLHNEFLCSLA